MMHDSKMEQCLDEELEERWNLGWKERWWKAHMLPIRSFKVKGQVTEIRHIKVSPPLDDKQDGE